MILTALASLYDRMAEAGEAPRRGFSTERIGAEVVIGTDGRLVRLASKLVPEGKRMVAPPMAVPAAVKRGVRVAPNLFWDKTAYALGLTAVTDEAGAIVAGQGKGTAVEHAAFRDRHLDVLADLADAGAAAFRRFLEGWDPNGEAATFPVALLDRNVVFRVEGLGLLHELPAALACLAPPTQGDAVLCLVTGARATPARLHPSVRGVAGAQSSGASLVSFNKAADSSHGKEQGQNAPVSEAAAFAYGTALNALLASERNRVCIGDATVVFWAETDRREADEAAEGWLSMAFDPPDNPAGTAKLRAAITDLAAGRARPGADPATRVYVLGLAPNAGRLSVRFWQAGTLGDLARHLDRFWQDLTIEPNPWEGTPTASSLLFETALQGKAENIAPRLGGDLMPAVLTGRPYPRTLLAALIGRVRADGAMNGRRAAVARAFIARNVGQEEIPVGLDPENPNPAYRLGRLFAVLDRIQRTALARPNATIKDCHFAAASATPARAFPVLIKNAAHHLVLMRNGERGAHAHRLDAEMGAIWAGLGPELPRSLSLEDQGRFIAGYFHQRWAKRVAADAEAEAGLDPEEAT